MATGNNANIGFEKQIWDAACVLWGHIPAAEYRKVIVGLIFLRYISSAFEKRYQELVAEGDGFEDDRDAYVEDNIFFVPEDARWSKIASAAHTPEIGTVIDDAMRAIEKENSFGTPCSFMAFAHQIRTYAVNGESAEIPLDITLGL